MNTSEVMRNLMVAKAVNSLVSAGVDIEEVDDIDEIGSIINEMSDDDILGTGKKKKTVSERRRATSGTNANRTGKGMGVKFETVPPFKYAKLLNLFKMNIVFDKHEIHYKEQLWPVPLRTVEYMVELVRNPMEAYRLCEDFMKDKEVSDKAKKGEIATYVIRTREEVKFVATTMGVITIRNTKNNKLEASVGLNRKAISECCVNGDKIKQNAIRVANSIISSAEMR